jgi:hypothetical protein
VYRESMIHARTAAALVVVATLALAACSSETAVPPDSGPWLDSPAAVLEASLEGHAAGEHAVETDGPRRDSRADGPRSDTAPASPYVVARGIIHLHSPYSHDACDGKGLSSGVPDATCLKQLRDAACASKFDFIALTDHPSYMSSYSMQEDLLYDSSAGDSLVTVSGSPVANTVACSNGQKIIFSVGFESTHTMPIGLHSVPTPTTSSLFDGVTDSTSASAAAAQVAGLKALGAVVGLAHSEETDLSASSIVAAGFEAMEWYNIHANFKALIGSDTLSADIKNIPQLTTLVSKLYGLKDFLSSASGAPSSDLVYLLFLDLMPKEGFTKWKTVLGSQPMTATLGSDIHQNVSVDASMCAGAAMQILCAAALTLVENALGTTLPTGIKGLVMNGGGIDLGDGDRIDSYKRLMRWLENRVLVKSKSFSELQDSIRAGRSYGVLTVFGEPHAFDFRGAQSGTTLYLGDSATGSATLTVAAPDEPVPMSGGVSFSHAQAITAAVRTQLYRTDSSGTALVKEVTTLGTSFTQSVTQKGAYHVEVWVKPKHLTTALGTSSSLAAKEYLWAITNPIYLR